MTSLVSYQPNRVVMIGALSMGLLWTVGRLHNEGFFMTWIWRAVRAVNGIAARQDAALTQVARRRTYHARPPCAFVQWMIEGGPKPKGLSFKDFMYDCFKRDVAKGEAANAQIPPHFAFDAARQQRTLRVMTFNVHFFQKGFSGVCLGDATDEVMDAIERSNPDVLMLQEVPPSLLDSLRKRLHVLGLVYFVAAGSADVHILDPSVGVFPNERLHVAVASKLPFRRNGAAPMLDGHAAFAEVALDATTSALLYSVHLSVRCEATKRRDEVAAVVEHARTHGMPHVLTIVAGDMNQPNEADYPEQEWAAIADDMRRAKLDLSDGAMECMRAAGFEPTFDMAATARPLPATTAWNGALVDYIYVSKREATLWGGGLQTRVEGTWAYHTLASDHLPLVADVIPTL